MHRVAAIAARHDRRTWLVGGPVRDLLLGREITDLDLTVDGAVQEIGRAAAKAFDGDFRWHPRFLTSTISFGGRHLDLAGTRTETYAAAAVLPRVRPAGIDADLARRDFSVNAMALEIRRRGYGQLIDPFGGRSDLRSKTLRVLHAGSFADDPTRAFRAARFAVRFGFHLARTTLDGLRASVSRGEPCRLSGERVAAELRRALTEPRAAAVLGLLGRWNLGAAWGAAQSPTTVGLGRLRYAAARLTSFRPAVREDLALRLACAFHDLPRPQRERIAERLRVRRVERRFLVLGPERAREILKGLRRASGHVAVAKLCRGVDVHFVFLAGLLADAEGFGKLRRWFAAPQT